MSNRVLYLSPTYEGKEHDKTICDEEQIRFDIPIVLWEDLGFLGLNPDVRRPVKKKKRKKLLLEKKALNRQISSKCVKVEHAIGQYKVLRIVKEEVRAFKDDFRDFCMMLACAINNFKIETLKT